MCLLIKWGISIYLNIYIFTWLIELSISKKKKGKLNGNSLQYITNHELKPNTDALPKTNKKRLLQKLMEICSDHGTDTKMCWGVKPVDENST